MYGYSTNLPFSGDEMVKLNAMTRCYDAFNF